MSVFKNLVGQRINGIFLGNDDWTLLVRTIDGKFHRYDTENDCCNSVWFNHINGVTILGEGNSFDLLRGAVVTGTEDKGWCEDRSDVDGHEVVSDGFWTIKTDRGFIDLEVRNSHNGYYGGSVKYLEEGDANSVEGLRQITEDF